MSPPTSRSSNWKTPPNSSPATSAFRPTTKRHMLSVIGAASRRALIEAIVPRSIARARPMALPAPMTEAQALAELKRIAAQNKMLKSCIGQGYHGTHTPGVILRNVLENPAWYTAYTPYQAEISQGRLEALVNFQTMVCDLTGMAIAGASMLDEATAAAEAMTLAMRVGKSKIDDLLRRRRCAAANAGSGADPRAAAGHFGGHGRPPTRLAQADAFAVLLQYPGVNGVVRDLQADHATRCMRAVALVIVAADLLALTLLTPPGEMGADIAVGNTQRFGMPMGNGGPHAAYLATPRRVQALDAGTPGGRQRRRARRAGLSPGAADARAAHPSRESHQQHLHGAGAPRRGGQHVRGLSRPGGPEAHRTPRGQLHGRAGVGLAAIRLHTAERQRLRYRCRSTPARIPTPCMQAARSAGYNLRRASATSVGITLDETTTRDGHLCPVGVVCRRSARARLREIRTRHRLADSAVAGAHQRLSHAPGVQPPPQRDRHAALPAQPRGQGPGAGPHDDPARFVHHEAQRRPAR